MSFDTIFKKLSDSAKKDPHSNAYRPGDISIPSEVPYGIPSGIPRLDVSIGRTGLPAGRVIEYFGFEKTGKTTAALHALAQAQCMGGGGLFIDGEQSWDEDRATEIGIDPNKNLALSSVDTIESIFRQMDAGIKGYMESGLSVPFVIIVDSITGVTSELEKEKEYGSTARVGEDARVIRSGMRKIVPDIAKSKVCVIFINHAVAKIAATAFAKQSDSSGGHAIKFFSSLRCNFANAGKIMSPDKSEMLGQKVNIQIEKLKKSKLRFPVIKEISLLNDSGFDLSLELLEAGIQVGMITKKNNLVFSMEDREFTRKDWPQVIEDWGGAQKAYEEFLVWLKNKDIIREWGDKIYG